jgi:hypothetical protein
VHKPLEKVPLVRRRRAPRKLELLVGLEEMPAPDQIEAADEVRPGLEHWTRQ